MVDFPEGVIQHRVIEGEIKWKPCPPNLPKDCEMFVLEGHPKKPDMFTVRFRLGKSFVMPAHTHPKDERVTLLSGKAAVGFGVDATLETAQKFGPGDYYINKRDAVHIVWALEPTVMQITGIGPWEAHFVK